MTHEPDFETTLEKVPYRGVDKDAIVYTRVKGVRGNGHSKWNKARVVHSNHSIVRIRFDDGGREAIVHYTNLYREKAEDMPKPHRKVPAARVREVDAGQPAPVPAPEPATPRAPDDEYQAWLAMGRDMLDTIDRQRVQTETDLRDIAAKLDALDASARTRIEALEAELLEAKREHQNDRAFLSVRSEQLTTKLASLNDRRQAMAQLMGAAS